MNNYRVLEILFILAALILGFLLISISFTKTTSYILSLISLISLFLFSLVRFLELRNKKK